MQWIMFVSEGNAPPIHLNASMFTRIIRDPASPTDEVSSLGWLERKTAATLYETPPTSSLNEALENFLKAEELNPGFSKTVRLYIAKCHKELGNMSEGRNWVQLALSTAAGANEDSDSAALQEELKALIDSTTDQSISSMNN